MTAEASGNLGSIEDGLASRIHQLQSVLSDVAADTSRASIELAEQVDSLRGVSAGALSDVASLVGALDERGRNLSTATRSHLSALADATSEFGRAEELMSQALTARRDSLDTLVVEIQGNSAKLVDTSRDFGSSVARTLSEAQSKTREIASALTAGAETTVEAITSHFERVRSVTGAEGERASADLKISFGAVSADLTAKLDDALAKFRGASVELREVASGINQELGRARDELKAGIGTLPRDMQDSTTEMRRVVVDQIKALNELASLVTKTNRGMDIATPTTISGPRRAPDLPNSGETRASQPFVSPAPGRPAVAQSAEPVGRTEPLAPQGTPSARTDAPRAERSPSDTSTPDVPLAEFPSLTDWPVAVEPQARVETSARSETTPKRETTSKSDPVRRSGATSRKADARPTRPAPAERQGGAERDDLSSLSSISADIMGILDGEETLELWTEYRGGDHDAFSRKLYTAENRAALDEIRDKHSSDGAFARTVDRYIGEFERLLDSLSKDDDGEAMRRTYLSSETGKVFAILAFATGRLS